jgi:hypothetical protein
VRVRLGFGRTARRFALRQDRDFGSILDAAEKITGDRFKELLSMLLSLRSRPRNLSKIRMASS